ncbi:pyridoxamine 5'-phosphate oxidase [Schizosaccharomyces japonicus yFS275]|uniref:Pyridoxamine 5'-phosphate oxidase n=1 Tax=Schizosaccharomyces japonicus (strain yFS275 / FY16936) TaxID=402676 RepID=B6K148_SCHJY|nr:pyridoxamine 5'-phosphate oxidase [Schizosaccharomyces japonicus yFS275]EEB07669.1 pyridoxamine 5'-phosphate oxidase [Schizosaccharomyces japonicus yFS275]
MSENENATVLPENIKRCFQSSKYLHLATCYKDQPHVALMNFTYVPSGEGKPFENDDVIILTMDENSKKYSNIMNNPQVSVLVHDWSAHRRPFEQQDVSSLCALLYDLNQQEISHTSVTLNGLAVILPEGSKEEEFFREKHLQSNSESNTKQYVVPRNYRVVKIHLKSARVCDQRVKGVEKWSANGTVTPY